MKTTSLTSKFLGSSPALASKREPARVGRAFSVATLVSWLVGSLLVTGCGATPDAAPHNNTQLKAAQVDDNASGNEADGAEAQNGQNSDPSAAPPDNALSGATAGSGQDWSYPEDPNKVLTGDPTEDDDYLSWTKHHGFETLNLAVSCVSKKDGEATIEGQDALPVGDGRYLECVTDSSPVRGTMDVVSTKDARWCALGQMSSYKLWGLPELQVSATSTPSDGPWTLRATHQGPEISVTRVSFGPGTAWPVGVKTAMQTVDLKPAPTGLCDSLF